jgi:uncharacterized membrane protein YhaH (DUF805 family)
MLKTRTDTFTDVTIYARSKTDLFIRHSRGIANIKLTNIDPETVAWLDAGAPPRGASASTQPAAAEQNENPFATEATKTAPALALQLEAQLRKQMTADMAKLKTLSAIRVNPTVVGLVLGAAFVLYLMLCYCLKLICQKAGVDPGILIWVPVFQMIPLLRAAGMSSWWFLALFIPVVNLIVQVVWCFKIVKVRGKNFLVAIGLLLPVTNLLSLLYLALSDGNSDKSSDNQKVEVSGPLPVEA